MFKPQMILVPTDFSECDDQCSIMAVKQAVGIASQFGSELVLLHVISQDLYKKPLFALDSEKIEDLKQRMADQAKKELTVIAERFIRGSNVDVKLKVRHGVPYDEILKEAKRSGVDLIVISSRGQSLLKEFFYGSTTEKVVRRAECTVMVARKSNDHPPA